MLYVALAEACTLALAITGFAGLLARQQRQHDRRQDLLINQLLHATGRTWTPPPAADKTDAAGRADILASYTTHPGPDDEA